MLACHSTYTQYMLDFSWISLYSALQQPTAFSLHTLTLKDVFDEPALIGSLSAYAYARHEEIDDSEHQKLVARRATPSPASASSAETKISLLFLRIFAAADYYALDEKLMESVPPVFVDIILDPYIFNVFPTSLLPTAAYILVVAVASWFLSGYIWQLMRKLAVPSKDDAKQDAQTERKTK